MEFGYIGLEFILGIRYLIKGVEVERIYGVKEDF